MAKKVISFLFFALIAVGIKAQINCILNYSFEQNSGCAGIGNCSWTQVNNWYQPTGLAADWFSSFCGGSDGVPQNYAGYQYSKTGNCYAGFTFAKPNIRSYNTGTFTDSLIPTKKYCIAFYVSVGDSVWYCGSAIGAYLSNDSIPCNPSSTATLPYIPQIENPLINVIIDKVDWSTVSGEYTANGGEKFITIGDFYSDTLSHFTYVGNGGTIAGWQTHIQTYYYIDNVSVRELTIAVAGKTDTICAGDSTVIGKDTTTVGVSFHWLPTAGLSNPNIAQPMASPTVTTTYTLTVVNDSIHNCNCADSITKDSITISVCTGIEELKNYYSLKVSPNPNNGIFTVALSHAVRQQADQASQTIEVYNVLGQKVIVATLKQVQGDNLINLSNQPNGVYLIRVIKETGELVGSGKVVIGK